MDKLQTPARPPPTAVNPPTNTNRDLLTINTIIVTMIKLNIYAMKAHGQAIARGDYKEQSSPMMPITLASVQWRKLHQAQMDSRIKPEPPSHIDGYTRREEYAALEIVRLLEFLQHVDCKNIEGLIRQIIDRNIM